MKKTPWSLLLLLWVAAMAHATDTTQDDDPLAPAHKSLAETAFSVETDEQSASESLDRISGKIDLGFADPTQTYESSDHTRPGPFGRQDAADKARTY